MDDSWPQSRLGDHVEVTTGFPFKSKDFSERGVRLARGKNVKRGVFEWTIAETKYWPEITPDLAAMALQEGDVLIGMDGSRVGENWVRVSAADLPCLLVQRVARLKSLATMDQRYVRYLIGNPSFTAYVKAVHTGTSIPHISVRQIRDYIVPVPPLADQVRIGELLGALDDKIELNGRISDTLEGLGREVFAELVTRRSSDWPVIRLGDATTKIGSGATPRGGKSAYLDAGDYTIIRSQNVRMLRFDLKGLAYISNDAAAKLSNVEVVPEDVLLNITGDSVARCCMVDPAYLPARVNQHVAIIRMKTDVLDPFYALYWLAAPRTQTGLMGLASAGATRNALTKAMIERLEIPVPPLVSEQQDIATTLRTIEQRRQQCAHESRVLATIRDTLLPKVLSGTVRLGDAEAAVEAVT